MTRALCPRPLIVGALLVFTPCLRGDLVKYKDWPKSPAFVYLATDAEKKEWKAVTTDAEAEKTIELFWARRNPDLSSPVNEFRQRFDALVKLADDHFQLRTMRGSLTERGRLFILLGPPKSITVEAGTKPHAPAATMGSNAGAPPENDPGTTIGENLTTFTYEARQLPAWATVKSLVAVFAVEQTRDSVLGAGAGEVRRVEVLSSKVALKNPDLTEVPAGLVKVTTQVGKPGDPPPASISAAAVEALESALAKEPSGALTLLPLAYRDGGVRLAIQAYAAGPPPAGPVRVAWLVRAADGSEAARGEETVVPRKALAGIVVDRAIPLPPGDYHVAFALLSGTGTVLSAARPVSIAATGAELAASPLFLAAANLALEGEGADAPFVFAGRRFVSRGSGKVARADGLCYLIRLSGPGVDPATGKAYVTRRIRIQRKGQAAVELPTPPDEPVAVKKSADGSRAVLDVAGIVSDSGIGEYFQPGDYLFKVGIEDKVRNVKIEVSEPFTIVPD